MALTANEFEVLKVLSGTSEPLTQRDVVDRAGGGISLGSVNAALTSCKKAGLIANGLITEKGIAALEPYRVDNAVIMAAGLSSRFAPISYERPKGLLRVRGEVLIERQIKQLLRHGITDITVVVGYKKEYFFYLAAKYGVHLVVNDEYATRNNSWTLWLVRDRLRNTYICSSDDYFETNPFERYVYHAYYASVYVAGPTKEWCMGTGTNDRVTSVSVGGENSWIMLGHAYFDRTFSERFVGVLEREINKPETADKLWESLLVEHLDELDIRVRQYEDGDINEFDSLDELEQFDPHFIENVDSEVFDNIHAVLGCAREDAHDFYPLKNGLTNMSFHFAVGEDEYVYRHPGVGTDKFINRKAEADAEAVAFRLGVDPTFIYEDPERGWKISRFVRNARNVDPRNADDVRRAMSLARTFHESGASIPARFDFFEGGVGYEELLKSHGPIDIPGYFELRDKVERVARYSADDGQGATVFCHSDYLPLNFLIGPEGSMAVIDWEFAGMGDPGNDTATFIICSGYGKKEGDAAIDAYFGRPATFEERRHFWSRVVLGGWCWYVWALEKEAEGAGVGEWLYTYYSYCVDYIDEVLAAYGETVEGVER